MSNENNEQKEKILQLVREAVHQDKILREQYQIGGKFRFIQDRLQVLLTYVEDSMTKLQIEKENKINKILEDEVLVYVYLYNSQGLILQAWQKMLNPAVFYEYSVNRPIYLDQYHVESYIRSKVNNVQHGYLTVAVKKNDILPAEAGLMKDSIGNPLIRVREGSLLYHRLISFTYTGHLYGINKAGELVKKE